MIASTLLSRLDGVRQTGPARWIAKCPAHPDRGPSLSICETDDGRLLVHDFGGCAIGDVIDAVGLELRDLFRDRPKAHHLPRERKPFHAEDVLHVIFHEVLIVEMAGEWLLKGAALESADRERLGDAVERIRTAAAYAGV